ncbi:MAG: hypothetical protein HXX10_20550 [Rhodoplanes sp.]|uniref:hypothetical protein n=1 Tax=Rhodoplanes sp. TaxID=1968906 RepID=UPI00183521C4|nr:hypothetical protein [Rhodoplanes sp.]NVO16425.1 hypothetical protein [Rhodoplanes sp.]
MTTQAHGAAPAVTAPAVVPQRSEIRAFAAADVPAVARLFKTTFRPGDDVPLPAVETYLRDLFIDGPDFHAASPSLVHVTAAGHVSGFVGSLSQPMTVNGRAVRAAHACSLMVADPKQDSLAGARLLRSFVGSAPDLAFSETSSALSRRMWTRLGGRAVSAFSMKWLRVLRPAGAAITFAARRWRALGALHPLGAFADRVVANKLGETWWDVPPAPDGYSTTPVEGDAAVSLITDLSSRFALRPAWSAAHLAGRLAHAAYMPAFGDLVCAKVTDRDGAPAGAFLYHVRRNGLATVLQILARENAADGVVAGLIRDAHARGAVALAGRCEPSILEALLQANCVILQRGSTTVHSRDPEVLAAIAKGDAMLTGLAGEAWSQLIGGLTARPHPGPAAA